MNPLDIASVVARTMRTEKLVRCNAQEQYMTPRRAGMTRIFNRR